MNRADPDSRGGPRHDYRSALIRLGLAEMVCWGALYYSFPVVQVAMQQDAGWDASTLAGSFSLALLVYALAGPVLGPWFDRRGPWATMVMGAIAGAVLLGLWSQVNTPLQLYVLMGGLGLAMAACLYEPAFYLVAQWFPKRRAHGLFVLTFFGALASPIFLPMTGAFCDMWGWRTALLIQLGVVLIIGVPLLASLPRQRVAISPVQVHGDQRARRIFHEARFWWWQAGFIVVSVTAIAIPVHLVAYLVNQGLDLTAAASVTGGLAGVGIIGRLVFGFVGDGRWLMPLTMMMFSLMTLAVVLLLCIPGLPGALIFVACFGLGYGALWPTRAALVAQAWAGPTLATISGWFACGPNIAKAMAPLIGALLARELGMEAAFACLAGLPMIGAGLIYFGHRHTPAGVNFLPSSPAAEVTAEVTADAVGN